ncbi:Hypothetical predicted protein [Paramuricea clavata]|uniref:Uncharacterized protein n=1 Tax=Paramuricea clavata TaxID=317549 RepID=A0A6S7HVC3_PARCT|nr:Hypothetical predicted protein [Paramuricea clavata]
MSTDEKGKIQHPSLTINKTEGIVEKGSPEKNEGHKDPLVKSLRRRAKYLAKLKEAIWLRLTKEHIDGTSLCSKVVIIRGVENNRNQWKLGILQEFIKGKDGVITGDKFKAGKGLLEQPVQHLYPLQLSRDKPAEFERKMALNPEASVGKLKRDAAVAAGLRVKGIAESEKLK